MYTDHRRQDTDSLQNTDVQYGLKSKCFIFSFMYSKRITFRGANIKLKSIMYMKNVAQMKRSDEIIESMTILFSRTYI